MKDISMQTKITIKNTKILNNIKMYQYTYFYNKYYSKNTIIIKYTLPLEPYIMFVQLTH